MLSILLEQLSPAACLAVRALCRFLSVLPGVLLKLKCRCEQVGLTVSKAAEVPAHTPSTTPYIPAANWGRVPVSQLQSVTTSVSPALVKRGLCNEFLPLCKITRIKLLLSQQLAIGERFLAPTPANCISVRRTWRQESSPHPCSRDWHIHNNRRMFRHLHVQFLVLVKPWFPLGTWWLPGVFSVLGMTRASLSSCNDVSYACLT